MGSIKRKYNVFDFDLNATSDRTVTDLMRHKLDFQSSGIAKTLVYGAYKKIKAMITQRKELKCNLVIRHIYASIERFAERASPQVLTMAYIPEVHWGFYKNGNDRIFEFNTIVISLGVICDDHLVCCLCTLLINPIDQVKMNYNFLQPLQRIILYNLRDGVHLYKVYESAIAFAESKNNNLPKHLDKLFGCIVNRGFIHHFVINSPVKSVTQPGMIFAISVTLSLTMFLEQ